MQESCPTEDHQNIVQCYNECSRNVSHNQKLYFDRNCIEPYPETIMSAVALHCNNNPTESYAEVEDADMSTNSENEFENEIIIKDEIEIEEERHIKTNDLKLSSEFVPVVYTTRLDDMQIFMKNFASLTVTDIVENVIHESKPKLTEPLKHQEECITFDGHPFLKLVEKIKQLNEFSTSITLEDSEEENIPLNLLTPKCGNLNVDRPVETNLSNIKRQTSNVCKSCTIPLVPSRKVSSLNGKSYVIYDSKNKNVMSFFRGVRYKIGIGSVIVFRNLKTNSSEIFVIEKHGLLTKTSNTFENCSDLYRYQGSNGLNVDECCWFYREYVINSFIGHKTISPNILRKVHSCPPGQCNCCCEGKFLEDDDVEEVPIKNSAEAYSKSPERQFVHSLKKSQKKLSDKFIIKALAYTKNEIVTRDISIRTMEDLTEVNDRLGVQILKDYSDMTEFYELKSKHGNIVKHIEMKSKYLHRMSNNFRKAMKLNADSHKVYCCWRKRDAMLRSFEFKHRPMITQFIRTPHPCSPDHCICCCKPSSLQTSFKVDDLTSLKYAPKHGTSYTSIIKQRRKFLAERKNILKNVASKPHTNVNSADPYELSNKSIDSEVPGKDIIIHNVESFTQKSLTVKSPANEAFFTKVNNLQEFYLPKRLGANTDQVKVPQKKKAKPSNILKKASVVLEATQPVKLEPLPPVALQPGPSLQIQQEPPPLVPYHSETSQLIQRTIAPAPSNIAFQQNNMRPTLSPFVNASLQNNTQGSTVNSLVTSILHRFQDVRLIITPDGEVSAELNMPVQTLSKPELQLLSKILTHAKEQVKELKAAGHLEPVTNTVLNSWPMNLESNTNSTQAPGVHTVSGSNTTPVIIQNTLTAPVVIANTNLTAEATQDPSIISKVPTTSSKSKTNKENISNGNTRLDAFRSYTNLSALKMKEYLTSCRSYINDIKFTPKIRDVFSLNENAKNQIVQQKSSDSPNSNTSCLKRKRSQSPRSDTKKPKIIETIDVNTINSVTDETPTVTLMPILQPTTGKIIVVPPLKDIPRAPILSGLSNIPYLVPGASTVINPNQVYVVPVPLPGSVAQVGTPYNAMQSLINDPVTDSLAKDDDCILGF